MQAPHLELAELHVDVLAEQRQRQQVEGDLVDVGLLLLRCTSAAEAAMPMWDLGAELDLLAQQEEVRLVRGQAQHHLRP